jgi:choline-sulfatase
MPVDRPNVVFVSSDQHCHRHVGYTGHDYVETPNLDRIAADGVAFESTYCSSPVCTPSRASLMTGVYPSDVNSFCNSTVWDGSEPTWGARLQEAGYRTWSTGKLELDPEYDVGFEEIETHHGHAENPDITSLFRRPVVDRMNERPMVDGEARTERHHDAEVASQAERFLRESAPEIDGPWAMYAGFTLPHAPFHALESYYEEYYPTRVDTPNVPPGHREDQHLLFQRLRHFKRLGDPIPEERVRRARAAYSGMVSELDEYVGRLLDALEESGELEQTVFVYTSDHGEMLGEHGLWYKNALYEDAARVPLVMTGGGLPSGRTVEAPVGQVDLVHTLLEWAGAETPDLERGQSLSGLVEGDEDTAPEYVYAENHSEGNCTGSFMIRRGDWKYVHVTWYDDLLFNLAEDPNELDNRIDDPAVADVRVELRECLHAEVDPETITERAFEAQESMLAELAREKGEDGLFEVLRGRLGDGQARTLAKKHAPE